MVTTRNRTGNPPPPPARPPTVFGSSRRRFAATPIIDIPSSSESGQNAAPDPPSSNIRLDRRAPRNPSFLHDSSSDFSIPPRDSAGPSRPRPREPSPSDTFYSMPTMLHSQSMPDAYSAHSYVHEQADNPEVNSEPVDIAPLMVWHPVYGFSGSEFPNPPPQPSPEPTRSSHFRHSPPPSFAASFDGEDAEDDHIDSDYHARRRRGRAFAVPSDEVLQGYLDFDNEDAVRFRSIRHRRFQVCKYIPDNTLDSPHLRDAVMHYFDAIGWRDFAEIRYSTYYELVFEFYSTFTFLPNRIASNYTPGVVSFRLLGQLFEQSLADFNYSMGFVTDVTDQSFLTSLREIPVDFDADAAYATLTHLSNATYNAKSTKGWHIHDPALRYIHRFLAYSYFGRNDSSAVLTKVELFFLWCMHSGLKVNLGFWFARAFERVVRTDRPLILGPYITRLASRLFPLTFNANEFTFAFTMDALDARCLDSMGLLAGTPSAPHLVPSGTTTPRDGRVFLRRTTHPAAPSAAPSSAAVHDELHQMHDQLHTMEANISEILSYLRPGSSTRGRGRGRR
ncbi:hypothetical protein V6N12_025440 [Hibiscus sabdariffa]|uniref:Arabidopsis retrotransposon Orf1 C-terminal domain-containing protein n=1 Tax=Hibiscus sabdariffa TaxID=183260 RepID=A0ABR2CIG4_9ROSI